MGEGGKDKDEKMIIGLVLAPKGREDIMIRVI